MNEITRSAIKAAIKGAAEDLASNRRVFFIPMGFLRDDDIAAKHANPYAPKAEKRMVRGRIAGIIPIKK